jgi:hypothetical protein
LLALGVVLALALSGAVGIAGPAAADLEETAPTLPALGDVLTAVGEPIGPITITADGSPDPTVTVDGLPSGLLATDTPGETLITGTPTAVGPSTVTATAANGVGDPVSGTFTLVVGTLPTLDVPATATVTAGVAVRLPVTMTGHPAPTLTADGLPAWLTLGEDPDGWALTGTPSAPDLGSATVTLTATNGLGVATTDVVLTATSTPAITGPTTLALPVGVALGDGVTFTATGYPAPVMTYDGSLPAGVTAATSPGQLTLVGTPTTQGVWEFSVFATNSQGTARHNVEVTAGDVPKFTTPERTISVQAGARIDTALIAPSWPAHTLTILSGALPAGVSYRAIDGWLVGQTPDAGGRYTVQVEARNSFGAETQDITIDLLTPAGIPAPLPSLTTSAGTPVIYTFVTTGWDPPTVTVLDPLPDGLTLTQTEDHTWQIAGTPTRDGLGVRTVRLGLTNEYGVAVTKSLSITINAAPMWDQPSGRTFVVARGEPIDPVRITVSAYPLGSLIFWGNTGLSYTRDTWTTTVKTGWITGTPTRTGLYSACPGTPPQNCVGPVLATSFTVQDRPRIDAPVTVTMSAGEPVSIPIMITGTPTSVPSVTGLPDGLVLMPGMWIGESTITGTVGREALGEHTITVTADNGLIGTATITLTVTGPPEVTDPVTYTAPLDAPVSGTVVQTTGYPLPVFAVVAGNLPPGVSAYDNGAGGLALTGTPTTVGTFTVALTATNPDGVASTSLTIDVTQAAVFPSNGPLELTLREGEPVSSTLVARGHPALTWTVTGPLPTGVTFSDGEFYGIPAVGSAAVGAGRFDIVVEVSNTAGSDTLAISLVVRSKPTFVGGLPTATFASGVASSYTFITGGWDPATATIVSGLPEGLALTDAGDDDPTTWAITGTVARELMGRHSVRIALETAFGVRASRSFSLEVTAPFQWEPYPTDVYVEAGKPMAPLAITATGNPLPTGYELIGKPPWLSQSWAGYPISLDDTFTTMTWTGTAPTTAGLHVLAYEPSDIPGPEMRVNVHVTERAVLTAASARTILADGSVDIPVAVTGSPTASVTVTGLPAGLDLVELGSGLWAIRGSVGREMFGTYQVTLTADNGLVTTHDLTLTVAGAPEVDDTTITAHLGTPVDAVVSVTGNPRPTLFLLNPWSLPPGVSATHNADGGLDFTVVATTPGSWTFAVVAETDLGFDDANVTIQVLAAPVFDDTSIEHTLREGDPVDFTAHLTGYPAPTVELASGTLPDGLSLSPAGRISGTPQPGSADTGSGRYELVLRATNTEGQDTVPVTLVVLSPPDIPAGLPMMRIDADTPVTYTFTTSGWDRPVVTAVDPLPEGLTLTQVDEATWQLTGTVNRDERGPHAVRFALDNTFGHVVQSLEIMVHAPVVWGPVPAELVVETGVPITPLTVTATGFPFMTTGMSEPSWVAATVHTRTLTDLAITFEGTPPTAGPSVLEVRVFGDGQQRFTVTFLVTDRPVIDAPTTQRVLTGTTVDIPVTVTGSPTSTVTATGLPGGLALIPGDTTDQWRIAGIPTRDGLGGHTVTLTADNGLVTTHTLDLDLQGTPSIPAFPTDIEVPAGEVVSMSVTLSGLPIPTVEVLGDLPAGLTADASEPGVLRIGGTPVEPGTAEVTVRATNIHGVTEQALTFLVSAPPTMTAPDEAHGVVGVGVDLPVTVTGWPAPAVTATGLPGGLELVGPSGTDPWRITGVPTGPTGDHTVTLTAHNTVKGEPRQDTTTLTIRIDAQPVFRTGTETLVATVGTPTTRTLLVSGAPEAALVAAGLPTWLTLTRTDVDTWTLTGTAPTGAGGRFVAHLTADNGILDPVTETIGITVRERVTVLHATIGELREGTPATIDVTTQGGWPLVAALQVDGTLPDGLQFADDGDGTGRIVGTPATGTVGRWPVTLVADNGVSPTRAPIVLTIEAPPVISPFPTTIELPAGAAGNETADEGDAGSETGAGTGAQPADSGGSGPAPEVDDSASGVHPEPWMWVLTGMVVFGAAGVFTARAPRMRRVRLRR